MALALGISGSEVESWKFGSGFVFQSVLEWVFRRLRLAFEIAWSFQHRFYVLTSMWFGNLLLQYVLSCRESGTLSPRGGCPLLFSQERRAQKRASKEKKKLPGRRSKD